MHNGVYSRVIESIHISEGLRGNSSMVEESYSSRIRPLPPRPNLKESEITFGLCVDVYLEDAWREGVLVGRKRDCSQMLVFFPETSDEILVPPSEVRLTQDWNEVLGHWRHRGPWFFLEIVKKIQQKKFVLSEIKEMWFQLKGTDTFREKIKIWYSGPKLIWNELVLDVIRGTKSAVSSLPATQSSSSVEQRSECWAHERVGRSSNEESFSLASTSHTRKCFSTSSNQLQKVKSYYSRREKHIQPHNLDSGEKFMSGIESYIEMEVDGQEEDEKFRNNDGDGKIVLSSACDIKFTLEKKEDETSLVASRAWKPMELVGEYCPDLLELSCFSHAELKMNSMKKEKLVGLRNHQLKLRKHLVSIGWRIESKRDTVVRFKYTSPEQKIYYSLIKVLQYLRKKTTKMGDKGKSKDIDSDNNLLEIPPPKADFVSLNHDQIMHPIDAELSATQQTAESFCGESASSGLMNCKVTEFIGEDTQVPCNCLTMINEIVDPKENSKYEDTKASHLSEGVIKAYVDHIKMPKGKSKLSSVAMKELRSRTKDYLLEKGWKFLLYDRKVRMDLQYTSPNGRKYNSLYVACKGYLEEVHCENTKEMSFESINDDKSFNGASNNLTFITPNKNIHELPCSLHLSTHDNQKSSVIQKEGPFSSSNYSKEHLGRKREPKSRKVKYQNSLMMQKEGLEPGHFSSSNLSDSGEFDFKNHSGKKSKLKRRKLEYLNLHMVDEPLLNNYCDHKHAVKIGAFGGLSKHKQSIKSFTSLVLRSGKRSRWATFLSSKDQVAKTLLSWLISKDVVLPRQKVAFVRKTDGRLLKEGWITQDGIKCRCCLNVFPLSRFGAHAGSRTSTPSTSIILQDGRSLLDCQKQTLSAFKPNKYQHARLRRDYSNQETDDICTVCGDGGLIMLCDLCPSAFHPACIGLEDVPEGQWFCPSCQCDICGLCEFNYDTENFTQNSGIYCDQCERQYHVSCLQKQGLLLKERPTGTWTCSKACSKINSHLQLFLGKSNPTNVKGLHWTILRSNIEDVGKFDEESRVEHSSMLHIALDVLHECFQTIVEERTHSDLAADIIFNNTSELSRLNFGGFYTMLLMCEDELISVATFRIFGERLAEMPFIGTRVKFRRQGMCRILMNELQQLLSSLGVERLLLPAVPELLKTWISSFGFTEITPSDRLELLQHTLLTFQGTTLCHKFLKKSSVSTL